LHSDSFIDALLQEVASLGKDNGLSYELSELISKMRSSDSYGVSPNQLRSAIASKHRKFANYSQHDSQELLRLCLETLGIELSRCKTKESYKIFISSKEKRESNEEFHKQYLKREDSIVLDYFYGQFCNTFTCTSCKYQTFSFEKFVDIPIYLGDCLK
jgi:ubiquitin C-terminal hydrolase